MSFCHDLVLMIRSARRRLPSTTALLAFMSVASTLSITRSAEALCVTQGAVSRQIAELESFLGTPLFVRERQRLALTEAGRRYRQEIAPLLNALEQATLGLRSTETGTRHLNLSIASTFGNRWLIPRMADFYARHPDIALNFTTCAGMPDFDALKLHAALVLCDGAVPGYDATFIHPLRLFAVAAPALVGRAPARRSIAVFDRYPLLGHTTVPTSWDDYFAALGEAPITPQYGPRFDLMTMGHQAAVAGLGIALLPGFVVNEDLRARRLMRVHPHEVQSALAYFMLCPTAYKDLPAIVALRSWLVKQAQTDPSKRGIVV